ncbi:DNA-binding CsgD family transcriptional regulator [Rhodoblastus acidophilus]|uniref:hypothetical protein n=1 Tax=Rhodoblastus acidophilus TaxID=1074 RepID=UPI002224CEDA|nr:hypothetical protein [Rhodoblastus acidophilus]MCW2284993.1 DNA-binding CsgD family transcriptional regulator [Rhodoblastus acidophilus]MCW2333943.1 DNA-binding CsgD family transcriptional regulator [Rhodoblastus acidophilus]
MTSGLLPKLLDSIHAASLDMTSWPEALAAIAGALGAPSIGLAGLGRRPEDCWGCMVGVDAATIEAYTGYYHARNPAWLASVNAPVGAVQTDRMVVPAAELEKTEFYNDFLRPQGVMAMASAVLRVDAARQTVLTVQGARAFDDSQLELMRRIAPHLMRALEVNTRLALATHAPVATLKHFELTRQAALFVDRDGGVLDANAPARALLVDGLPLARRGVSRLFDPEDAARLRAAIARCAEKPATTESIVLRRAGRAALKALVTSVAVDLPWRLPSWPTALVMIEPAPDRGSAFAAFGFTAAEAALAEEMLRGEGVAAAARRLGVARSTARTHLARLFQKTHTHSQAELVLVLLGRKGEAR